MNSDSTQTAGMPSVDLDSTIDAVARQMTEFEPSGALRARVLEHIEQGRRPGMPALPRWAWVSAAAAVVLAVATAVWVVSPMRAPGLASTTIAERRPGVPSPATGGTDHPVTQPAVSPAALFPAGGSTARLRTRLAAAAQGAQTAEPGVPEDHHPVPALADIEPLRFSAVGPEPLQIAAVEVAPLAAVPSIDIPSLAPGSNDIQSADPNKEK
jgi:hypothetical protein